MGPNDGPKKAKMRVVGWFEPPWFKPGFEPRFELGLEGKKYMKYMRQGICHNPRYEVRL